jgi:hypothetical protein
MAPADLQSTVRGNLDVVERAEARHAIRQCAVSFRLASTASYQRKRSDDAILAFVRTYMDVTSNADLRRRDTHTTCFRGDRFALILLQKSVEKSREA